MLDLSKIESGKMEVYIEDINMQQLLCEIKATTRKYGGTGLGMSLTEHLTDSWYRR